ncbi:hypothetical protein HMPREF1549_00647 [Actinomyces johnsonii F0510]|uniref:Uncharacterized protein n=1 Tax=Actinomyces johnsonii F0510 TaxID=1227262 RepID=U1QGS9_9ACTO|nr:hypothetical protein HMPREF1549_00647 [Actinomyces johnsonii F0510]
MVGRWGSSAGGDAAGKTIVPDVGDLSGIGIPPRHSDRPSPNEKDGPVKSGERG